MFIILFKLTKEPKGRIVDGEIGVREDVERLFFVSA
jgi:hypothetical protein